MNYPLLKPRRLTLAEFREMELNAPEDERWELIDGQIVKSMAGGTIRHNILVQNIAAAIRTELRRRGSACRPFTENVRLDSEGGALSTLPDVVVSCDPYRSSATMVENAVAVFEVHSTASRERDRSTKLEAYMRIPSVQTIVLVEQRAINVVTFTRSGRTWVREELTTPDDHVTLQGLDLTIPLPLIYEEVEFDD